MSRRLNLTSLEDRAVPSVTLVKDINRATDFGSFATLGNSILFVQSTPETGPELWRTDGTPGGTALVKDVVPGPNGPKPPFYQQAGGLLYLTVTTPAGDIALWRTDGTADGTIWIKTIDSSSKLDTMIGGAIEFQGQLIFSIYYGGGYGRSEIWKTDGTPGGTKQLLKMTGYDNGYDYFYPRSIDEFTVFGDTLYFPAGDFNTWHLWKSDGTLQGTQELKDLAPGGILNPNPSQLTVFNGELYFAASGQLVDFTTTYVGEELWKTDGTPEGTILVKDIYPGFKSSDLDKLTVVGDTLYFKADDGTNGSELWKSDGTDTGTTMVANISPGASGSSPLGYPDGRLISFNGSVYFTADNGVIGRELWTSNGMPGGTMSLRDVNPGLAAGGIQSITQINGSLYFVADDGSNGREVWKSDGTPGGTDRLIDLESGVESSYPSGFVGLGPDVYWFATTLADGQALWKSDGTTGNSTLVLPTPGHPTFGSGNAPSVSFNGSTYFAANGRLWQTDGTPAGTVAVTGATPILATDAQFTVYNGTLYFRAFTAEAGVELWSFNGTSASLFADISPGTASSNPSSLFVHNGLIFFTAATPTTGFELWKTDGTGPGTSIVKDIRPGNKSGMGADGSGGKQFVLFNGLLYFPANDGVYGTELWKTDGTGPGTVGVRDINPDGSGLGSLYASSAFLGNQLYFWATDPNEGGKELWKTNGTGAGTLQVTDLSPPVDPEAETQPPPPAGPVEMGGNLYFLLGQGGSFALWKVDGATGEVSKVKAIPSPSWFSSWYHVPVLRVFDDRLYFLGYDGSRGAELWTSDGTAAGTHFFVDIVPGGTSAFRVPVLDDPEQSYMTFDPLIQPAGNGFIFQATDGDENYSIWWSDGTSSGTRRIADGSLSSVNGQQFLLGQVDDVPIFWASTPEFGLEPFRYDPIVANPDSYSLEDALRLDVPAAAGILANDTDGIGKPTSAILVDPPAHGTVILGADGSFTYQPINGDFSGIDTFTYRAAGPVEQSAVATVSITVDAVDLGPVAENDAATGRSGRSVTIKILSNDHDPDHDTLVIDSFTQGTSGKVRQIKDTLRYYPQEKGPLVDTFTYTIRDARGETATATVTVTLIPTAVLKVTAARVFPGTSANFVDLNRPGKKVLPFGQLSRIAITFAADVSIAADDLRIYGEAGAVYTLSGFTYDSVTHTASWLIDTPAGGKGNDRLRFLLDGSLNTGALDALGNPLGDRVWNIGLLTGDFNGNKQVTAADVTRIARQLGCTVTWSRRFYDLNGDGVIDQVDLDLAAANLGMRLV